MDPTQLGLFGNTTCDDEDHKTATIENEEEFRRCALIQLLYTPLLIRKLGQGEYGLYSLVYSIIGYLTILDLGFGKCRMCICGPESAKELLNNGAQIRVATKYPQIAKEYFYNVKHQTVEIIKLNGSIELAPIVGLADVICDIVETGTTLKENGLFVLEEVCPLSARMIVNPASMKMENERITTLIRRLKEVM